MTNRIMLEREPALVTSGYTCMTTNCVAKDPQYALTHSSNSVWMWSYVCVCLLLKLGIVASENYSYTIVDILCK